MKRLYKLIAGMLGAAVVMVATGGCSGGLSKNGGGFAASFNER